MENKFNTNVVSLKSGELNDLFREGNESAKVPSPTEKKELEKPKEVTSPKDMVNPLEEKKVNVNLSGQKETVKKPKWRDISKIKELVEVTSLNNEEVKEVQEIISYLDDLMGYLPEGKIREFSQSTYYDKYLHVLNKLGIR